MATIKWGGVSRGQWEGGKSWRVEFARLDVVSGGLASCQPEFARLLDDCLREARRSSERKAISEVFMSGKPTHVIRVAVRWGDRPEQPLFAARVKLDGVFYSWNGDIIPADQALIELGRWFRSLLSSPECGARQNSQQVVPGDYAWKYWCQAVVMLWLILKAPPNSRDE